MDLGTILIWLSLLLAIGIVICTFLFYFTKIRLFRTYAMVATIACMFAITISYLLLSYYFLTSNFDIHYVWENSGKALSNDLKLAGVWAGQEGSLLLWVWIILLSLGIEETIQYFRRRKYLHNNRRSVQDMNSPNVYDWTRMIVIAVAVVFLILLVLNDPFEPVHEHELSNNAAYDPEDFPGGFGMNPMQRNIWMVIHPPLLFIGFALITIPFAASIGYALTNDKKWTKISLQWSRLAWLFLTLGIGIGAIWAYLALGWGGYWGWDPVEVGSLVPWITLTGFMHAQLMNKRKNEYSIMTPILGTVTFVLVIFATFITRSGLWTSVHAWSETEVGLILMATMICTLVLAALIILRAFILKNNKNKRDNNDDEGVDGDEEYNWEKITMITAIIIFAIMAFLTFVGLLVTMQKVDTSFYETRLAPFTIILMIVLSVCLCWRYFGKENTITIVSWMVMIGIACALLLPKNYFPGEAEPFYYDSITTHHIVGFMIPFAFFAIFASIFKIIKQLRVKTLRNKLRSISPHIIHLGVAFIIIGYIASQTMITEVNKRLNEGDVIEIGDYDVKVTKIEIEEDTNDPDTLYAHWGNWDTWTVTVEIYQNKEFIQKGQMNVIKMSNPKDDIRQPLFYLDHKYKDLLTNGYINDELRKEFNDNKLPLADDAVITQSDEEYWKYIYHNNPDPVNYYYKIISGNYVYIIEYYSYLFGISPDFSHYLQNGTVSHIITEVFDDNKIILSNATTISRVDNMHWIIEDGSNIYLINNVGGELRIFDTDPDQPLTVYGIRDYSGSMSSEVFVGVMPFEDLYLSFNVVNYDQVDIQAKTIPMMSFIWGGMILFVIGIALRLTIDYIPTKKLLRKKDNG